ncbi:MAG TPA: LysR substrate-binding domain-containing protein [Casimicrobiaceae bacterium]|jgi:LysR family nitrogen assimilation transcriptional regulator
MNLRQLRYFAKVVEVGNMTRAAGELHVAQPALGMQIRQLEEDLGVALLVRHSRGVDPTPAGAVLHRRALAILGLVEDARREVVAAAGNESESVRLGLTPALMLVLGAEIAIMARERSPHVFLSLSEGMSHVLADRLLRGDLDMALGYDMPDVPQLERTALMEEDLVFVTLPVADAAESIPFADVVEEVLILPEQGDSVRNHVTRAAQAIGAQPNIAFEVRSIPAMKSLILRGAGSGVLPYAAVLSEVREGRLLARRVTAPALRRALYLAVRTGSASPRNAVALRALVRESLHELVATLGPLAHPLACAE